MASVPSERTSIKLGKLTLLVSWRLGYPVTGGFARSVVNFDAGAETPLAGAYTAVGILAATLFLTPLFRFLPQAVLAATIIIAVLSLVDFAAIKRTFVYSKADFAAMAMTIMKSSQVPLPRSRTRLSGSHRIGPQPCEGRDGIR